MKRFLRILFLVLAGWVLTVSSLSHIAGCGGADVPPASIPAPVSSLITVSEPDPDGLVLISGAPGAVEPAATVVAANITQGGVVSLRERRWEKLFLRTAFAQIGNRSETTADDQGAFFLELIANNGDQIDIVQIVDGEESPPTTVFVP